MNAQIQEIQEDISSKEKIIAILKKQLRQLELQAAQFGSAFVPPYVLQQITNATDQIEQREAQLAKLRTKAVEQDLPLAEVEYRLLVAQTWNQSSGWLSIVDKTRLELERLKLGMDIERVEEHHRAVRTQIATETLLDLELNYIQGDADIRSRAVQRIIRAFRLDPNETARLIRQNINLSSIRIIVQWLEETTTIWQNDKEANELTHLFQQLLDEKRAAEEQAPFFANLPQRWEGLYSYSHRNSVMMILSIDELKAGRFSGETTYPDSGAVNRVKGEIVTDRASNPSGDKWSGISNVKFDSNKTYVKFTETQHLHGHSQIKGWYYAVIEAEGQIDGIWFPNERTSSHHASFHLTLHFD